MVFFHHVVNLKLGYSLGTVNLPNGGRAKMGLFPVALRGDTQFGDYAPRDHRLGTKRAIVR
jgi:hypothetical protein